MFELKKNAMRGTVIEVPIGKEKIYKNPSFLVKYISFQFAYSTPVEDVIKFMTTLELIIFSPGKREIKKILGKDTVVESAKDNSQEQIMAVRDENNWVTFKEKEYWIMARGNIVLITNPQQLAINQCWICFYGDKLND